MANCPGGDTLRLIKMDSAGKREWATHSDLLQSVSRSFFLSVKFLPREMRETVALGYLLARLSDTIADTESLPVGRRRDLLSEFQRSVRELDSLLDLREIAANTGHSGEKALLLATGELIDWLDRLDSGNQEAIQSVLEIIISGQSWDLEHFTGKDLAVSGGELLEYTYRVAGSVGEFWTRIGYGNLGEKFARSEDREFLMESGRKLGQGLQLVNILRDLHEDIPGGRHYLPGDDFDFWLGQCREFLEEGKGYVRKIRSQRVKIATALPLYLAEATADAMESAGCEVVKRKKVKVSRGTVWKMIAKATLFT